MKIRYLGHASFAIETKDGVKIITDPYRSGAYDGAVGYKEIDEEADIVTVTHSHDDHNAVDTVKGKPVVVDTPGEHEVKGIKIRGIKTYHDPNKGAERGENTIYVYEIEGKKLCHLGDLGEEITHDKAKEIGEVDILFIPVGGYFTIDAKQADSVIEKLNPKVVIPMHYKTDAINFPISPVEEFLKNKDNYEKLDTYEIELDEMPAERKIIVLRHKL